MYGKLSIIRSIPAAGKAYNEQEHHLGPKNEG